MLVQEANKTDLRGKIGSLIMLGFAVVAVWRWQNTGLLFFALVGLRDLAAAYFLAIRLPDRSEKAEFWPAVLAYASSALPFFYFAPNGQTELWAIKIAGTLAIVGFSISTLALIELGRSFGVAPAERGRVSSGIYKWISHPIYSGYVLAEFGMVLLKIDNSVLFFTSVTFYCIRIKIENKILENRAISSI